MRHKVDHRKLGLPSDQRMHLLTTLQRQLIAHGYVRTTLGRAKETQRLVEKLITLTKSENQLDARRRARRVLVGHSGPSSEQIKALTKGHILDKKTDIEKTQILANRSLINGEDLVKHLFDNVGPRYKTRPGGYTRITKIGPRRGDAAPCAVLELV